MAAIIGDFVSDLSRFNAMVANTSPRQSQRHQQSPPHRQRSHSRAHPQDSPGSRRSSSRPRPSACAPRTQRRESLDAAKKDWRRGSAGSTRRPSLGHDKPLPTRRSPATVDPSAVGSSKFLSPPPSSSPTVATDIAPPDNEISATMATKSGGDVAAARPIQSGLGDVHEGRQQQQPSPPDGSNFNIPDLSASSASYAETGTTLTQPTSQGSQQTVIHVRDLAHMQSLADAKMLGSGSSGSTGNASQIKYEISGMPIADVIEMVAALLTKITTTNDLQHDAMQRNVAHQQQANQSGDSGSHMSSLSHSVLAFHGKNVPAITILSYLSRIHKYCPTTYEVFLSLLVYFDRMTERVNDLVVKSEEARSRATSLSRSMQPKDSTMGEHKDEPGQHIISEESDSDLADDDDDDDDDDEMIDSPTVAGRGEGRSMTTIVPDPQPTPPTPATYFVVDSFNIHRLIISGVTCASKFFSDVFYTNSRYAKVGGLPLPELNHLEIQFLVLNDFRLAVPVEELEAYATMLVEFYAREVMTQRRGPGPA